jgi:hypothetical protein
VSKLPLKQLALVVAGGLGAAAALLRRRKSTADTALWREATSDSSS